VITALPARPRRPRALSRPLLAAAVLAVLSVAACAEDAATLPTSSAPVTGPVNGSDALRSVGVSIVLPPAELLEPAELARVRMLVERALDEAGPLSVTVDVLQPATVLARSDLLEVAARRSTALCVLGGRDMTALAEVRLLYPALRTCVLPSPSGMLGGTAAPAMDGPIGLDVDLAALGADLGRAARAVAGDDLVIVLDGGDPMLDPAWAATVRAGALPGPVGVLLDPDHVIDLLALLDARALGAATADARDRAVDGPSLGRSGGLSGAEDEEWLDQRDLQLGAVVLDASPGSARLAELLLERGVAVLGPRSILVDRAEHPSLAVRWRVRWDVPLAQLLRAMVDGTVAVELPVNGDPVLVLESGPALDATGWVTSLLPPAPPVPR